MNGRMIKKTTHSTNAKENCVFIYKENQKVQTKESYSKQNTKIQIF